MPSYRFCRPDDIPRLVQAINDCYAPHFPGFPEFTVEDFRREMVEQSVWPSNCMVALAGEDPIAVMIGTKREHEVLVRRVAAAPGHQRQGHCGHMLTSLSQKLAVLGPPRLIAEVPTGLPGVPDLFSALGYASEATYYDYHRPLLETEPVPAEWVVPIAVEELLEDRDLLPETLGPSWPRCRQTLEQTGDLRALAIASPERLEAAVIYGQRWAGAGLDVLALATADASRQELFAGLLVRALATTQQQELRLPRVAATELPDELLVRLGFERGRRYQRVAAVPKPG